MQLLQYSTVDRGDNDNAMRRRDNKQGVKVKGFTAIMQQMMQNYMAR